MVVYFSFKYACSASKITGERETLAKARERPQNSFTLFAENWLKCFLRQHSVK